MLQRHRWSSLSDDIIAKIISHINFPKNSTVTISASKFDVNLFESVKNSLPEIWKILDNLFTIFTTPSINTFSLHLHESFYKEPCVRSILDSWGRRLRACNTRHIAIIAADYFPFDERIFPPSVFQIHSLVRLHLSFVLNNCDRFFSHPIILPNLKELVLIGSVDYGFLGRLLSSCPSLIFFFFILDVKPKDRYSPLSISSKTLNQLSIIVARSLNLDDTEIIIDAPMMNKLSINANSSFSLYSISSLESLVLNGGVTSKLFNSPTKTIFPNLTNLTLSVSSSEVFKAIFEQQMSPHYCPNLEVLVLNFSMSYDIVWDTKGTFMLVENVKHLELHMCGVRTDRQKLNLVTWFLRSGPVLKKLVIRGYGTLPSDDSLSKFRKTVLKCAEDTSGCEINFLGGYKLD